MGKGEVKPPMKAAASLNRTNSLPRGVSVIIFSHLAHQLATLMRKGEVQPPMKAPASLNRTNSSPRGVSVNIFSHLAHQLAIIMSGRKTSDEGGSSAT